MAVEANIIFIHVGTHATIPAGFTRDTDLDGLYVLGPGAIVESDTILKDDVIKDATIKAMADYSASNGGGTGGVATHNHTVNDHNHVAIAHTHTLTIAANSNPGDGSFGTIRVATVNHTHANTTSTSTTTTLNNASITLNTASNDAPHYEIIFVKSDGTNDVADDLVGFWDGGAFPTDWNECDGTGTTPDLQEHFLKGAGAGSDSNLVSAGDSDAHTHTVTSTHTHTENSHIHTSATTPVSSGFVSAGGVGGDLASAKHTHQAWVNATTATLQVTTPTLENSDGQPPFKKLVALQNNTGGDDTPTGIIGLWTGNYVDIPAGWSKVPEMNNYFLKIATGVEEIGDTGGGDNHIHLGDGHTHVGNSHTGAGNSGISSASTAGDSPPNTGVALDSHNHSVSNSSETITYNEKVISTQASESTPEYIVAIFIKKD